MSCFPRAFWCLATFLCVAQNEASYKVTMFRNKDIQGCIFQNTSETTVGNCLARCLENCLCRLFRMCDAEKTCRLCLSYNSSLDVVDKTESCKYFILERNQIQVCRRIWFYKIHVRSWIFTFRAVNIQFRVVYDIYSYWHYMKSMFTEYWSWSFTDCWYGPLAVKIKCLCNEISP